MALCVKGDANLHVQNKLSMHTKYEFFPTKDSDCLTSVKTNSILGAASRDLYGVP